MFVIMFFNPEVVKSNYKCITIVNTINYYMLTKIIGCTLLYYYCYFIFETVVK